MLIVRTWFPNSFFKDARVLPYLVTDVSLPGHPGGNKRELFQHSDILVTCSTIFQMEIDILNEISSETPRKAQQWFCYCDLSPLTPSFTNAVFLQFLSPSGIADVQCFFKKAQPWLSVLDVSGSAGANWKHTTEGRESARGEDDSAGSPVRNDPGLRCEGKAAKGGRETFEGEKNPKNTEFQKCCQCDQGVKPEWCSASVDLHHEAPVPGWLWPFYFHSCLKLDAHPLCNAFMAVGVWAAFPSWADSKPSWHPQQNLKTSETNEKTPHNDKPTQRNTCSFSWILWMCQLCWT